MAAPEPGMGVMKPADSSSAIDDKEFDDEHGEHHPHRNSVHHRLRASSSIMQLKKLLGK
jgi:pyruvate carboxylase